METVSIIPWGQQGTHTNLYLTLISHIIISSNIQIDFVAHDDIPYVSRDSDDVYKEIKEMGMFVATQRTEGVSTSDVITRIVKHYDMYISRNLARGYTPKDLNIGFMKVQKADEMWVCECSTPIQRSEVQMKEKFHKFEERSREAIMGFVGLFGKDGRIVSHHDHTKTSPTNMVPIRSPSFFKNKKRNFVHSCLLYPLQNMNNTRNTMNSH